VDQLTDADYANIDCLICHSPDYSRAVVKEGDAFKLAPAEGVDAVVAAQNAQRPTSDMCLRCHLKAAGGPNFKHGDIPTPGYDVHRDAGIVCVDCHYTENHRVAGGGYIIARDDIDYEVTCTNCHSEPVHSTDYEVINDHTERIACQTCHIPLIARDPALPTQMTRDYSEPVYNEAKGLYGPKIGKQNDVVPLYLWWNGWMKTPPEPVGTIDDPEARIFPWKPMEVTAPFDAETHTPIYIKQGVYKIMGDLGAAITKGVEASGQEYSGSFETHTEWMVFDVQHQVAPASESLKCGSCHATAGVLDFAALGYSADQVATLTTLLEPADVPESGGMPLMPGWAAMALAGLAAMTAGVALRRRRH
jgi:hypothetical protein